MLMKPQNSDYASTLKSSRRSFPKKRILFLKDAFANQVFIDMAKTTNVRDKISIM